ncbi:hypothetical protein [uncultured Algoriphagus sp.]|uniref:hypothetical protein n=1 Tax=uncultured Algoriphagus sp. TaxID=417365 RepID=UPI0030EBA05D|tara:strand:+ start:423 stop:605 length:183 start_codon:yes stop_codon:yes gene_type:complete
MHVYEGSTHKRAEKNGISRKTIFSIEKGLKIFGECLNVLKVSGREKNILKLAKDSEREES